MGKNEVKKKRKAKDEGIEDIYPSYLKAKDGIGKNRLFRKAWLSI